MSMSIGQRISSGFIVTVTILLIVGGLAYRNTNQLIERNSWVEHTLEVITQLNLVKAELIDGETGARGYVITGREEFLEPYNNGFRDLPESLQATRKLTQDNPSQQKRLDRLDELTQGRFKLLATIIQTRRDRGPSHTSIQLNVFRGKLVMDQIRTAISEMEKEERRLLNQRNVQAKTAAHNSITAIGYGTVLAFLSVFAIGLVITRSITEPLGRLVTGANLIGTGNLEYRLLIGAEQDEIGELAVAFNEMAAKVEDRDTLLREQEQRLRAVFDSSNAFIYVKDRDGKFLVANRQLLEFVGHRQEEMIGKTDFDLFPPHMAAQYRKNDLAVLSSGNAMEFEEVAYNENEQHTFVSTKTALRDDDGEIYGLCGVSTDITERRRYQAHIEQQNLELAERNHEIERATKLKSEFLASMSHELRTPLNSIIGFSDLLADQTAGQVNQKQSRFLEHIRNGSRHLLELINDILDLSKIEAGQLQLQRQHLAMADLVNSAVSTVNAIAAKKRIQIKAEVDKDIWIWADRVRVTQILINLLSNAIKFTPEDGCVSLECATEGKEVRTSVSDTGVGIKREDHQIIFEAFRQAGETTRGLKEGTGLGLAITKKLVEQHDGRIWVESEPGKGSHFSFVIPSGQRQEPATSVPAERERRSTRLNPLILIIDDEAPARELLVSHISPHGYQAEVAISGKEGIAKANQLKPDAITLNMLMPGKNGWETLYQLKNDPATCDIPVIIVSVVDNKEMGFALGACEYLVKPVNKEELLEKIAKHVGPGDATTHILVVDDEDETSHLLQTILGDRGYQSAVAASGQEAIELLNQQPFQAVLLDLVMPGMDGFEVLRHIRTSDILKRIPVLVLTAKDLTEPELDLLTKETEGLFQKGANWQNGLLHQIEEVTHSVRGGP